MGGTELHKNIKKLLIFFGINPDDLIQVTEPTQFKEVVLPDSSFFWDASTNFRKFTHEYVETIDAIKSNTPKIDCRFSDKVYFSTRKKDKMVSFGEEKLERFFKKHGFEIFYPEQLSFEMQVSILNNCKVFASTDGSALHNCIFANDGTQLIIIPRAAYASSY